MGYLIHLATLFAIYGILAVGLNLVVGFTGMISVAHAAFFALGAYAAALLMAHFGMNFFLATAFGMIVSGLAAFAVGIVFNRLGGDYYVLGTVGFNIITVSALMNLDWLTGGPLGISGVPRPSIFGIPAADGEFLFLSLAALLLTYGVSEWAAGSSFGRVLKAIRGDEEALQVFGYRALWYKVAVFVLAAMAAALAGGLYASYISFIDPSSFDVMASVFILAAVILGGAANLKGSLLGALALIAIPEALRFLGLPDASAAQARQLLYGVLLVVLMRWRPQGFWGEYKI